MKLTDPKFTEWCEKFLSTPTERISDELHRLLSTLWMMENNKDQEFLKAMSESFIFRVVNSRASHIGLKIDEWTKANLAAICRVPGVAVMYVHALKHWQLINDDREIDVDQFVQIFNEGFPSNEDLMNLWDDQKIDGNNMLDMIEPN